MRERLLNAAQAQNSVELREEKYQQLQSALHLDSPEIENLHEKWGSGAAADPDGNTPAPSGTLLDAASARRLAADARTRERVSREALQDVQRTLAAPSDTPLVADAIDESDAPDTQPESSRWKTRALVTRGAPPEPEAAPGPEDDAATSAEGPRAALNGDLDLPEMQRDLRVARAEVRELESTLALARQTALGQKTELHTLRQDLATRDAQIAEWETRPVLEATGALPDEPAPLDAVLRLEQEREIDSLRERLDETTQHLEEARTERLRLDELLKERDRAVENLDEEFGSLRDRFEVQDQALEAARREYDLERQRHSSSLELLTQLRSTLSLPPSPECTRIDPEPLMAPPEPDAPSGPMPATEESHAEPHEIRPALSQSKDEAPVARETTPSLLDRWLDDQVGRHFGPMGIDRFTDLLHAPLMRRARTDGQPLDLLMIGRRVEHQAARFAEGLMEAGGGEFRLHLASPSGHARGSVRAFESPLEDLLETVDFPETPEALCATLEGLRPSAIICTDFLSDQEDVGPWLSVLEEAATFRACLLIAEKTGLGPIEVPSEMQELGQRIWERMPARYIRPHDGAPIESWRDAFEALESQPENQLANALREHFLIELSAQFGFLAEPFLTGSIAPNFDPEQARDRRFLQQISDLDDQKIEAGIAPALHLVALVEPLAEA